MFKMGKSSNEEFVDVIKKGRQMVELYLETRLGLSSNPAFAIFVLKNMGWNDKWKVENRVNVELSDEERVKIQERMANFSE